MNQIMDPKDLPGYVKDVYLLIGNLEGELESIPKELYEKPSIVKMLLYLFEHEEGKTKEEIEDYVKTDLPGDSRINCSLRSLNDKGILSFILIEKNGFGKGGYKINEDLDQNFKGFLKKVLEERLEKGLI